jgi:hypothetical protein
MKMTILKVAGAVTIFSFLLMGCASTAHIEKDDTVNFSNYKTFAWIDREASAKKGKNNVNSLEEQQVKESVNKELTGSAGWKEVDKNPDVLLSYDVLVERSARQQTDAQYSTPFFRTFYSPYSRRFINVYYPSQFMGYDTYSIPVKEGTVTISMIDAKTNKTVWQGWATNEVNNSRHMTSKEIQSGVRSIFRKFDIAKN